MELPTNDKRDLNPPVKSLSSKFTLYKFKPEKHLRRYEKFTRKNLLRVQKNNPTKQQSQSSVLSELKRFVQKQDHP